MLEKIFKYGVPVVLLVVLLVVLWHVNKIRKALYVKEAIAELEAGMVQ